MVENCCFFSFLTQGMCYGYSKDENPKHMLKLKEKGEHKLKKRGGGGTSVRLPSSLEGIIGSNCLNGYWVLSNFKGIGIRKQM